MLEFCQIPCKPHTVQTERQGHVKNNRTLVHWVLLSVVVSAIWTMSCHAHAETLPKPKGYVNDFAELLSQEDGVNLDVELAKFEAKTSIELVVVTVKSLDGYSVEDYARNLANRWGVGKKGENNGIMFLIAPAERKMRIAVGDGLSHKLPDSEAGRIINKVVIPRFRKNQLSEGIFAGVDGIMQALDAARTNPEAAPVATSSKSPDFGEIAKVVGVILLGLIIMRIIIRRSIARREREDNRQTILSLLEELPKKIKEAGRAVYHEDVTEETKKMLKSAVEEFTREKPNAEKNPVNRDSLQALTHVARVVKVATENAAHEKDFADDARKEGPKLLAKLPDMLAEAEKRAGGDRRRLEHIAEARAKYEEVRSRTDGGSIINWVICYAILSSADSHCKAATAEYSGGGYRPETPVDRSESYASDPISIPDFGGGSTGGGGGSGSW